MKKITLLASTSLLAFSIVSFAAQAVVTRKNVRDLSTEEKKDYVARVKALKAERDPDALVDTPGNNKYDKYVKMHANSTNMKNAHEGPAFLPWHREFILLYEQDLQNMQHSVSYPDILNTPSFTFALPYWDWTEDASLPDPKTAPVWGTDFMGGDGVTRTSGSGITKSVVETGPFTYDKWDTLIADGKDSSGIQLWKKDSLERKMGQDPSSQTLPIQSDVDYALASIVYDVDPWNKSPTTHGFRNTLEGFTTIPYDAVPGIARNLHNRVHVWIGGAMADVPTAPNDPVFFLHHCNIDRLWALWQHKNPKEFDPTTTTYPKERALPAHNPKERALPEHNPLEGHKLEDPMAPWNVFSKSPFVTASEVLDFRSLGYEYSPPKTWKSTHQILGTSTTSGPALAFYKDSFYLAFKANDASNHLMLMNSSDGAGWDNPYPILKESTSAGPALATYKDSLYVAFKANDDSNSLHISKYDGALWHASYQIPGCFTSAGPALAIYRGSFCLAFKANDDTNRLMLTNSSDGAGWYNPYPIHGCFTSAGPAVATYKDSFYVAFKANDDTDSLYICRYDEPTWRAPEKIPGCLTTAGPALASDNNFLYVAFKSNDDSSRLYTSAFNGIKWSSPERHEHDLTSTAPALASYKDSLYLAFKGGGWDGPGDTSLHMSTFR